MVGEASGQEVGSDGETEIGCVACRNSIALPERDKIVLISSLECAGGDKQGRCK